jgi:membrane protein required for colicin V production
MNWLDIVVIVFLAISTITGLRKGLIKTIIPLVGIIIAVVLAGRFYGSVADWLSTWLHSPSQANIAGFAIIFVAVVIASLIIASLLSKFLSLLLLGWVDKLGGAILGLVMGGLVCGAILTIITKYNFPGMEGTVHDSSLASFFVAHFNMVLPFLPSDFDSVRQFFD